VNELTEEQQWMRAHIQPGNWLRVDADEELPPCLTGPIRTLAHMFQLSFSPEIVRRKEAGMLPEDFALWGAQMIQTEDAPKSVRLNDEIRGVMHVRMDRPVEKGEAATMSDLRNLVDFDVADDELDYGHCTVIFDGVGWRMFFNFQAGRGRSLSTMAKAEQFLEAARYSREQGHIGPTVDNLFSACELLSKARLTLNHSKAADNHRAISSAINAERRLGNVDSAFVELFNRMSRERYPARYGAYDEGTMPTSEELDLVQEEIALLRKATAHKGDDPSSKDDESAMLP